MSNLSSTLQYVCDLCQHILRDGESNWHCHDCVADFCSACFFKTYDGKCNLRINGKLTHTPDHKMYNSMTAGPIHSPSPVVIDGGSTVIPALSYPPGVKKPILYFYATPENRLKTLRVAVDVDKESKGALLNAYPTPSGVSTPRTGRLSLFWNIELRSATDPTEACSFDFQGLVFGE